MSKPRGKPFFSGDPRAKPGPGSNGQLRRDATIELISQLNEFNTNYCSPKERIKLHRLIENLLLHALGTDYQDEKGTCKREKGDLTAILAIIDRLEGRAPQKISVDSESRLEVKLTTVEQVRTFLLERGIDVARVPPPPMLTAR